MGASARAPYMTPEEIRTAMIELDFVRRRRELTFWSIAMVLALLVAAGTMVGSITLLLFASSTASHVAVGGAVTACSLAGGLLLKLLKSVAQDAAPAKPRDIT
jgi:hypothetical protein